MKYGLTQGNHSDEDFGQIPSWWKNDRVGLQPVDCLPVCRTPGVVFGDVAISILWKWAPVSVSVTLRGHLFRCMSSGKARASFNLSNCIENFSNKIIELRYEIITHALCVPSTEVDASCSCETHHEQRLRSWRHIRQADRQSRERLHVRSLHDDGTQHALDSCLHFNKSRNVLLTSHLLSQRDYFCHAGEGEVWTSFQNFKW